MQTKVIASAFVFASLVFAQEATESRVFHFHHIEKSQDMLEAATLVRTISDLKQASVEEARKTMSVTGPAPLVRTAEWVFLELDRQSFPDFATKEFKVPNKEDDVARVFFIHNAPTAQNFQEIATTVRTITDMRGVFTMNTPRAVAVRGTADQLAATEFLVHQLDQPANVERTDSREYSMIDTSREKATAVRVFYLPYTSTVQQFQEVATLVRTLAEMRRVFTVNASKALVVRGTPEQVAFNEWVVKELAKPVTPQVTASELHSYPDPTPSHADFARVFYVKNVASVAAFQRIATQIRTETQMRRVFTYNTSYAIAVRGDEAQLARAQQILDDRQVALK